MRKLFRNRLWILIALTALTLAGCKDDPKGIVLTYSIELSEELQELSVVRVCFTDFEGKEQYVTLNSNKWEVSISTPLPPVVSKIRVETSRNGITPDKGDFNLNMKFSCLTDLYDDGNIVESVRYSESFNNKVNEIDELNSALGNLNFERSYKVVSLSDGGLCVEEFRISNELNIE